MELIIGGYGQGQMRFLERSGKLEGKRVVSGMNCSLEDIFCCGVITEFTDYVKRFGTKLAQINLSGELMKTNPSIIIVTDEIGNGIVPIDRREREYRELHGRLCCALAQESLCVYRVICGIESRIK